MNNLRTKNKILLTFLLQIPFLFWACHDLNVKPDFSKGFIKYFGGDKTDLASKVELSDDGGYVLVGTTSSLSNGVSDIYLFKADKNGNKVWEKRYGGSGADSGTSIKKTQDGYIVVGSFQDGVQESKMYILKINDNGDVSWTQKVGDKGIITFGSDISVNPKNDGYIFIGNIIQGGKTKTFLYKTDLNGNLLKASEAYGYENNNTKGNSIVAENDSVITWVGSSETSPILGRHRPGGIIFSYLKTQTFLTEPSLINYTQMQKTVDGGYIITGSCIKNGKLKAFLLKLGSNLQDTPVKEWFMSYGGDANEGGSSVNQTSDGGYILTGFSESDTEGGKDIYLVKTDAQGVEQWHKIFGGEGDDVGMSVKQAKDGGYIIASTFSLISSTPEPNRIIALIKTDANGVITNK